MPSRLVLAADRRIASANRKPLHEIVTA